METVQYITIKTENSGMKIGANRRGRAEMKVCADNHYLISCIRIKCSVCILETDVR
jgi:hypothetical protein